MPSETLWEMQEQTVAKHLVLKYYLNGWLQILGSWHGRLVYIDGFAGPGEYVDGEPGSPLIALDCVRRHKASGKLSRVEVVLLLIESRADRPEHLRNRLEREQWPADARYEVLTGTKDWQQCVDMAEESDRKLYLHNLFKKQLKVFGARYVVFFELWKGNRHEYTIYFATGHDKGCDLMKQAIWQAESSGSYRLSGFAGKQRTLFDASTEPLAEQLRERFGDKLTPIEDIDAFVMSDETIYHKSHLRQKTLQRLEKEGRISVNRPQGGRGFPQDKGIKVRFH